MNINDIGNGECWSINVSGSRERVSNYTLFGTDTDVYGTDGKSFEFMYTDTGMGYDEMLDGVSEGEVMEMMRIGLDNYFRYTTQSAYNRNLATDCIGNVVLHLTRKYLQSKRNLVNQLVH